MRYLIIGLGIYGSNLAIDLTKAGHEVIGADINPSLVEAIKEDISTAYILDSTDEAALSMLPLKNVDLVIVAIGENFGASIRTVALLRKLGVTHIYARAIDKLHESILESFKLDRIVAPEQRAAFDLVNEMELGAHVNAMRVAQDTFILKFSAPDLFIGTLYSHLDLHKKYGLQLLCVARPQIKKNILGLNHQEMYELDLSHDDELVQAGDMLIVTGNSKAYRNLFESLRE